MIASAHEEPQAIFSFAQPHIAQGQPKQPRFGFSVVLDLSAKQGDGLSEIAAMEGKPSFFVIIEVGYRSLIKAPNFLVRIETHFLDEMEPVLKAEKEVSVFVPG